MYKQEVEKYAVNGKITVQYIGSGVSLRVQGMTFPRGEDTRLSLTKLDRLKKKDWKVLEIVK